MIAGRSTAARKVHEPVQQVTDIDIRVKLRFDRLWREQQWRERESRRARHDPARRAYDTTSPFDDVDEDDLDDDNNVGTDPETGRAWTGAGNGRECRRECDEDGELRRIHRHAEDLDLGELYGTYPVVEEEHPDPQGNPRAPLRRPITRFVGLPAGYSGTLPTEPGMHQCEEVSLDELPDGPGAWGPFCVDDDGRGNYPQIFRSERRRLLARMGAIQDDDQREVRVTYYLLLRYKYALEDWLGSPYCNRAMHPPEAHLEGYVWKTREGKRFTKIFWRRWDRARDAARAKDPIERATKKARNEKHYKANQARLKAPEVLEKKAAQASARRAAAKAAKAQADQLVAELDLAPDDGRGSPSGAAPSR